MMVCKMFVTRLYECPKQWKDFQINTKELWSKLEIQIEPNKDINIYVDDELTNQLSKFVAAHENPLPKVKYVHDSLEDTFFVGFNVH
jgi:hypothetical protein